MFSFLRGKEAPKAEAGADFDRQLEKAPTEFVDRVESLKAGLQMAGMDRVSDDGAQIDLLVQEGEKHGIHSDQLRSYINGTEYRPAEATQDSENMQINSIDALRDLYMNNATVQPLVDKVFAGTLTAENVRESLEEAGYELDDSFVDNLTALQEEIGQAAA